MTIDGATVAETVTIGTATGIGIADATMTLHDGGVVGQGVLGERIGIETGGRLVMVMPILLCLKVYA